MAGTCLVMVHIKDPLLLIGKKVHVVPAVGFLSLSEWSFTICLTPYKCVNKNLLSASLNKFPSFLPSYMNVTLFI